MRESDDAAAGEGGRAAPSGLSADTEREAHHRMFESLFPACWSAADNASSEKSRGKPRQRNLRS